MCTLLIGVSQNTDRISNKVARLMIKMGKCVYLLGRNIGVVSGVNIDVGFPSYDHIDTVSMYLNPRNQILYYDYVINLNPRRVIFNPGTENKEFYALLGTKGIRYEEACTMVMLMSGQYDDV